jgi:ankyrin repeat protein
MSDDQYIDGHAEEPSEMRLGQIERAITADDALTLKNLLPTENINEVFDLDVHAPRLIAPETRRLVRSTALAWASAVGSTRVVEDLLNRGADVLSELGKVEFWTSDEIPDDFYSAFHLAAINGHTDVLKKLFEKNPALLELHTERGETALFLAAQRDWVDTVQYLLQRGANPEATSLSLTQTALHVACAHGNGKVCQALLNSILRIGDRNLSRAIILAKDSANRTAFNLAARNKHTKILLQLLETPVYFPRSLFKEGITPPDIAEKEAWRTFMPLYSWQQCAGKVELSQHGAAVGYWALTQREGFSNFVGLCDKVPFNRDGASWVHVAAVGGDVKVMEHFARHSWMLMTRGRNGIRPLHIAAACGHLPLVQYMLPKIYSWYTDDLYINQLEAHLEATEQGTTAVEFAAVGGPGQQNEVEQFLWDEVRRLVGKQHEDLEDGFFSSSMTNSVADDVLELAAKCATPGKEDKLLWLFQLLARDIEKQWGRPDAKLGLEDGRNALHWAIYFQKPTLVWWLLGNGTYTGDADIRHGFYINSERVLVGPPSDRPTNTLIQELLSDSPPIVKRPVLSGYNDAPSFKYNLQRYRDDTRAAIADFYNIQGQSHLQLKQRAIRDILYERGPRKIMHLSRYPDAKALTKRLQHLRGSVHRDVPEAVPPETHDLRWFHFSSNDVGLLSTKL